jgi:adenine specific DNA methylase Mod
LDDIRVPQKFYRSVNNMRGANPGNVWEFSHMHYCNSKRKEHPTQKPEALYERMILSSSNVGDVVLDPFGGSGTCLHVCQNTGRNGISIDLNPDYCQMTIERLNENFTGFDSFDEKMIRCPNDLNDDNIRIDDLNNHIQWFLKNHCDSIPLFLDEVYSKYFDKMKESNQLDFFKKYNYKFKNTGDK